MRRSNMFGNALDQNLSGWQLSKEAAARRRAEELFSTPEVTKVSSATHFENIMRRKRVERMLRANIKPTKAFKYNEFLTSPTPTLGISSFPKKQKIPRLSNEEKLKYSLWEKEWAQRQARTVGMAGEKVHGKIKNVVGLENDAMNLIRKRIEALELTGGEDSQVTLKINELQKKHHLTFHNPTVEEAVGDIGGGGPGQRQIDKMWGRYGKSREAFYRDISPKSFRQDLTPGGLLQNPDIDLKTLSEREARELRRQSEGFFRGLDIGPEATRDEISKTLAMREKDIYHNREKLIGFTRMPMQEGDIFMGRHTLGGSKLYMSPTMQRAEALDVFSQSKMLRDSVTGKVIPYKRSITVNLAMHSPVTKVEYLDSIRGMYKEAVRKGRIADEEKYRIMLMDATVDQRVFNPIVKSKEIKLHKTMKEINAHVKHDTNIARSISIARGGKRATSEGYEDVKSIVERMSVGDEVFLGTSRTRNPRRAVVAELESLRDASVLMEGGGNKVKTWGKLYDETMKLSPDVAKMPDLFEVSLIRNPTADSKYTIDIMGGAGRKGEQIGRVSPALENTLGITAGKEVASGYVGKAYVRPYIAGWNQVKAKSGKKRWVPEFGLGIWGSEQEAYRQVHSGVSIHDRGLAWTEVKAANRVQGESQKLIRTMMEGDSIWTLADLQKRMAEKYPSVPLAGPEKAAWKAGTSNMKQIETKFTSKHGRAMAAGAIVTAGALLLWGASRRKSNTPLTEEDVQGNLYGRSAPVPPDRQRMYTPNTRIVQNNTGYATNIDVESRDGSGIVDHEGMARTMSAISRQALGRGKLNTSLHVIDDSAGIDRESTRRTLNRQLSL